jgi:hypothetical protein
MMQTVGVVGVCLFFLIGSGLILSDKVQLGLIAGAFSIPFLLLAIVDWKALLAGIKNLMPKPKPVSSLSPASGADISRVVLPEKAISVNAPLEPVRPFLTWGVPKSFKISTLWILSLGIAVFLAGSGLSFFADKMLAGMGVSAAGLTIVMLALKAGREFELWMPVTTPRLVANLALGSAMMVWSFWLSVKYHPYWGFLITVLASVVMVYTLWKHLEGPVVEKFGKRTEDLLRPLQDGNKFSPQAWLVKGILLLVFMFSLFMWNKLPDYNLGLLCMVGGVLALVGAMPLIPNEWHLTAGEPGKFRRTVALLLFMFACWLAYKGQGSIQSGVLSQGSWLILAAAAILMWVMPSEDPKPENPKGITIREFLPFLLVAGTAFLLRFYRLDLFPYGVEGDEGGHALNCLQTMRFQTENIFVNGGLQLFWYHSNNLAFHLLGITPGTIRFTVAFHGALSVLTLYFLLRLLFNWRVALATAVLMSVGTWNLHYSRFGHLNITQVFAQSVALYYLLRGLMTGSLVPFILAGFSLSIAAQGHVSSRLLPVGVALFGVYLLFTQTQVWKRNLAGIFIFMICSYVMVSGVLVQYSRNPATAFNRVQEVSITNTDNSSSPRDMGQGLLQNFKLNMYMFNHMGDARTRDNILAPRPMLDFWSGILWAIGFLFAVYHWRRSYYGLALILFYTIALNSILSVEAPQSLRTTGNISIIYLFMAPVLARADEFLKKVLKGSGSFLATVCLIAFVFMAARTSLNDYWKAVRHQVSFDLLPTTIGLEAGRLGAGYKVAFMSEGYAAGHDPVRLFSQPVYGPVTQTRSHAEPAECIPSRETVEHGLYYAFSDRYLPGIAIPRDFYPGGKERELRNLLEPTSMLFRAWDVPKNQVADSHLLQAKYFSKSNFSGKMITETADAVVGGLGVVPLGSASAVWEGTLINFLYNKTTFTLPQGSDSKIYIDNALVATKQGGKPLNLAAGLHALKIEWIAGKAPVQILWKREGISGLLPYFKQDHSVNAQLTHLDLGRWKSPMGLLAHTYGGQAWQGNPVLKVDPAIIGYWLDNPLRANSTQWDGWVQIEEKANYSFRMNTSADNFAIVEIDKKPVYVTGTSSSGMKAPANIKTIVELKPGLHQVRILFATPGRMTLSFEWKTLDDKGQTLHEWDMVPPHALKPAVELEF